jgi:hypothetical protein
MNIFGISLDNQSTMYLMIVLTIVFGLISGILAYYSIKMPHTQHGHNDEDHH